jgi:A/G-specific adenine glycosylase
MLREAAPTGIPIDRLLPGWPDALQRDRAIDSLIADGLAEVVEGALALPR